MSSADAIQGMTQTNIVSLEISLQNYRNSRKQARLSFSYCANEDI